VNNFLWEFVSPNHEAKDDTNLQMRIPVIASVLKRPETAAGGATIKEFEDADVCSVLLSALERVVDHPLNIKTSSQRRAVMLSLQSIISTSGVFVTSDLMAQFMDMAKYSPLDDSRDRDATRLLSTAIRGSNSRTDEQSRKLWARIANPCDARVIGRYIAARDPWSTTRFCPQGITFSSFTAGDVATVAAEADVVVEGVPPANASQTSDITTTQQSHHVVRTASQVSQRWSDLNTLIDRTQALSTANSAQHRVEVFTGLAIFLRHLFTGYRLNDEGTELIHSASYAPGMTLEVCEEVIALVKSVKRDLDTFCDSAKVEPELECWESLLVVLRSAMDFLVLQKRSRNTAQDKGEKAEEFFVSVSEFRSQMLEESRTRFNGRFALLWLHEA
jgi:hypothetical protein